MYGSLQAVHTNFHAKSGVCSSKNGRVMAISLIFPSLRIFYGVNKFLFARIPVGSPYELPCKILRL